MSNGIGLVLGCILIGVFIGIIISNIASTFSVEITPNNTLKAAVEFA